ncbi:MAG: tetratricopeptide repeat protein [Clostridia bacterium]|nr:tetratricopeptide repeat protein [Clostridia bacterium]
MTKFDPKVVSFQRNASYLHEKALKNRREGLNADAMELMRKACEQEPENVRYKLDLAEIYSEMGLFEQASRTFTEILLEDGSDKNCLYGMAVNLYKQGEISRAERALGAYVEFSGTEGRKAEAKRLMDEISIARRIDRPANRKLFRAMRLAAKACDQMNGGNNAEGARLFKKSLEIKEYSDEVRALYAHSLLTINEREAAVREADKCLKRKSEKGGLTARALWLLSQVYEEAGDNEKAKALIDEAVAHPDPEQEMHLRALMFMDDKRYEEAEEAINRLLKDTPYDKQLLHMLSVVRYNLSMGKEEIITGWRRIQRLDPYDPVADYYLRAMDDGKMPPIPMTYAYAIPVFEAARRVKALTDVMLKGENALKSAWDEEEEFRKILEWELYQKDSRITRLALAILASINIPKTRNMLRIYAERPDVSVKLRLYAMYLIKMSNIQEGNALDSAYSQAGMPSEEELMADITVSERQMIRLAAEYIKENFGEYPTADIALIWRTFKEARGESGDPVRRIETGSAALALFYMEMRGMEGDVMAVSKFYACPPRQTAYIAGAIRNVFHSNFENE